MAFYSPELSPTDRPVAPDMSHDTEDRDPTFQFLTQLIKKSTLSDIELDYIHGNLHEFTFSDIGGSVKVYINREKAQVYVWYASPTLNPEIFTFDETGLFAEVQFAFTILSDRGQTISYSEFVNALTPII